MKSFLKFLFLGASFVFLLLNQSTLKAIETFSVELFEEPEIITYFGIRPDKPRSFHYGVDISAKAGTPFLSPVEGTVFFKGFTPESSETLTIKCSNGYKVTILNLVNVRPQKGDSVKKGDLLGYVSSEPKGSTVAPHVHLSLRDETGKYLDPLQFITFVKNLEKHAPEEDKTGFYALLATELLTLSSIETPLTVEEKLSSSSEKIVPDHIADKSLNEAKPTRIKTESLSTARKTGFEQHKKLNSVKTKKLSMVERNLKILDSRNFVPSTKNTETSEETKKHGFAGSGVGFIILSALLILSFAGIISAQSLLLATAGGRLSPEGGEMRARIRNYVHCKAPSFS